MKNLNAAKNSEGLPYEEIYVIFENTIGAKNNLKHDDCGLEGGLPILMELATIRHSKMKQLKNTFRILALVTFIALPAVIWSQEPLTYKMDLVRAVQFTSENQHHILTILKVTPTVKDFKMIMSMRVTYEIGQGSKVIDVQKQKEDKISIAIYGTDMAQKNSKLFELVQDRLNLNTQEDVA